MRPNSINRQQMYAQNLSEVNIKGIKQYAYPDQTSHRCQPDSIEPKQTSCCKICCISTIVNIVTIVIIGALGATYFFFLLPLQISQQQPPPQSQQILEEPFKCQGNTDCEGVQENIRDYILEKLGSNHLQTKSLLQLARVMNTVPTASENPTQEDQIKIYDQMFRATECADLFFEDGIPYQPDLIDYISQMESLQYNTIERIIDYFNMVEEFSGQHIRLTPEPQIQFTCGFTVPQSIILERQSHSQRRLQSSDDNCTVRTAVHFITRGGYSPSATQNNLQIFSQFCKQNPSTEFDYYSSGALKTRYDNLTILELLLTHIQQREAYRGAPLANSQKLDLYNVTRIYLTDRYQTMSTESFQFIYYFTRYLSRQTSPLEVDQTSKGDSEILKNFLAEGTKIVIFAHSLGTIYANLIYQLFSTEQKRNVGLLYISTPVNAMADGTRYYTNNPQDYSYRNFNNNNNIPPYLPDNVPAQSFYPFNQQSVAGYLKHYPQKIGGDLQSVIQATAFPDQSESLGNGPITVQLTWGTQPNLDLHIFEPTGSHVYYSQTTGSAGVLDRVDTDGNGPQHYYTNCSTTVAGNYEVWVNFFSGTSSTAQEQARIVVSAGIRTWTTSITVSNPRGSLGDDTPIYHVCRIEVKQIEGTSELGFTVIPR